MSDSVLNLIATHVHVVIAQTPALYIAEHDPVTHALHRQAPSSLRHGVDLLHMGRMHANRHGRGAAALGGQVIVLV